MKKLLELIHSPYTDDFSTRSKEAIEELFGSPGGRYPDRARQGVSVRAPEFRPGSGVPFTALIDPSNPDSGAYGGMSFVIFPGEDSPAGIAMVVGTQVCLASRNYIVRQLENT